MNNNTTIIPIAQSFIAGKPTRVVSARKLYEFLEVKREFSNWIKARIEQYKFKENQDFILIRKNGQIKKQGGDKKSVDYHLTVDMAKELAMVERNEKGRQARLYFIGCEKQLIEKLKQEALPPPQEPPKLTLDDFIPDDDAEIASNLESLLYRSHKEQLGVRALICIDNGEATLVKQLTSTELIMDSLDIYTAMTTLDDLSEYLHNLNEKHNIDLQILGGII